MTAEQPRDGQPLPHRRTALLMQGGGALGSYHHGVYEALSASGYHMDWFAGTSIGGIQAAILAGNPPERRLERLAAFWQRITWPQLWPAPPPSHPARKLVNLAYAMGTMVWGQPGFFRPDWQGPLPLPWKSDGQVHYYDISPLRRTLEELIDFRYLNESGARLSLGAVEVETGRHVYFDTNHQRIDVRHVLATGALPPAFPAIEIDGARYWDGGLLSNTPLSAVLEDNPRRSTLCFMVDLFDPQGPPPTDLDQLEDRRKDIIYSSRAHTQIDDHTRMHDLRRAVSMLFHRLPEEAQTDPELAPLKALGCTTTVSVVHFVYPGQAYRSWAKDFTFLPQTLADHRERGYQDAARALRERPWDAPLAEHLGAVHYEINRVAATTTGQD